MATQFDRSAEDLGNSVHLEHLNLTIPDQQPAILFYIVGLGFTRDPYLLVGLQNMWVNIGRSQIHMPAASQAQAVRGHVGLVVPDLKGLVKRLEAVREKLAGTRFEFSKRDGYVEARCPWGNEFRCYAPDEKRFGRIALGLPYIAFDVVKGAAEPISRFYSKIIGVPVEKKKNGTAGASTRVTVGMKQHLVFNETSATLPPYDGHHIQIYVANFSGPHRQLGERDLISEESDQYQYRFRKIVDPETGELAHELEHEVRSVTHPLYARPLVNRNPEQSNRGYMPGYDAAAWSIGSQPSGVELK